MDIVQSIKDSIEAKTRMLTNDVFLKTVSDISNELIHTYKNGGKLLIAGNGGSAADAQHFAAEITCQYMEKRKGRPALALSTDTSALTAWSNDYSYTTAFSRLVEAHGCVGDALIVISTSGNSENLIQASATARKNGIKVFGLLGRDGGNLLKYCDVAAVVPSLETPRIQECHILLIHALCSELDTFFLEDDKKKLAESLVS